MSPVSTNNMGGVSTTVTGGAAFSVSHQTTKDKKKIMCKVHQGKEIEYFCKGRYTSI